MENQLESSIYSMSDSDFDSILSGNQQSPEPATDPQTTPESTVETAVNETNQSLGDDSSIMPLGDDFFKDLDKGTEGNETPESDNDNDIETSLETDLDPQVSALQNITDFFIEEGLWDDFEGREEFDFKDNKKVAELLTNQTQKKAYEIVESVIESTGDYGKAIINYIQNGGDPDDLIDLFKEQKQVQQQANDINSDEGKKEYIQNYYVKVANMKPDTARKVVSALEMEGELDSQLAEVKAQYDVHYKQEQKVKETRVAAAAQEAQAKEENFRNTILSEVTKRNDLTDKQRRALAESILVENQQLSDGTSTSKFYAYLAAAQNNVNDYLELVEFVTDKENYKKRIQTQTKNEAKVESFNFIKRNSAVSRKTGSNQPPQSQKPTTFKFQ